VKQTLEEGFAAVAATTTKRQLQPPPPFHRYIQPHQPRPLQLLKNAQNPIVGHGHDHVPRDHRPWTNLPSLCLEVHGAHDEIRIATSLLVVLLPVIHRNDL